MFETMKKQLFTLLMLLLAFGATACLDSKPFEDQDVPPHVSFENTKQEGVIRLVTYNVGVFKKTEESSYVMVANMMQEIEADAVCLNELDSCTSRSSGIYQIKYLTSLMPGDWDFHYRGALNYKGGKYGEGVMTRHKAVDKASKLLSQGNGAEPRVLVVMEMDDYVVCTSHLDHVSTEAQLLQVREITEFLRMKYGDSGKPVFLGGDMNATPDSETGQLLQEDWEILSITGFGTFPSDKPRSCIDYFMQLKVDPMPECEVVGSQIMRWFRTGNVVVASDHLPVMLDVKIPVKN